MRSSSSAAPISTCLTWDAWAERFVDEIMIPKFIARDWNVSHATSLYEDGPSAGPVTKVTPSHACVTCMS